MFFLWCLFPAPLQQTIKQSALPLISISRRLLLYWHRTPDAEGRLTHSVCLVIAGGETALNTHSVCRHLLPSCAWLSTVKSQCADSTEVTFHTYPDLLTQSRLCVKDMLKSPQEVLTLFMTTMKGSLVLYKMLEKKKSNMEPALLKYVRPGIMSHACNSSSQKVEAGSSWVQG